MFQQVQLLTSDAEYNHIQVSLTYCNGTSVKYI